MGDRKPEETSGGDRLGVKEMALRVEDAIRLYPPSQERGSPRGERIGPRQMPGDAEHPKPGHADEQCTCYLAIERTAARAAS